MRIKTKKLIAMLMALVMLLSLMPVSVFAEGEEQSEVIPEAGPVEETPVEVLTPIVDETQETTSVEPVEGSKEEPKKEKSEEDIQNNLTDDTPEKSAEKTEGEIENVIPEGKIALLNLAELSPSKTDPSKENFTFTAPANPTYDGQAKVATVKAKDEITGMGTITVKYSTDGSEWSESEPVNAGTYKVAIDVEEGTDFNAVRDLTCDGWKFTIAKATPTVDDFTFTQPANLVYDGQAKNAKVEFNSKGDTLTGMGVITVLYAYGIGSDDFKTDAPAVIWEYQVYIEVAEGTNYAATTQKLNDK